MARALELAKKGLFTTAPNPRVGALLVKDGQIIGEGWHQRAGGNHAEVNALEDVDERSPSPSVAAAVLCGASCFITLEPCAHYGHTPPCADALIEAGVKEVIIAMIDPNPAVSGKGIKKLQAAGIKVRQGLLQQQAEELNAGFILRMTQSKPWVVMKLAMSVDGRTALANGVSQWISSAESRQEVQRLRAQVCGILTGSGTVISDNPRMTVRVDDLGYAENLASAPTRQPVRVIIDGQQRLTPQYQIFREPGTTIIVLPEGAKNQQLFAQAAKKFDIHVMQAPLISTASVQHLDLSFVLQQLAVKWQMNELMVEAGAGLSGAILQQGLFDELQIFMAPKVLGDQGLGLFNLPTFAKMDEIFTLNLLEFRAVGVDMKLTFKAKNC